MRASEELMEALKMFEGYRAEAYRDSAGVWTIGYGHTHGVRPGQRITRAQAESLLRGDVLEAERYVNSLGLKLTQGKFDALTDFAYNVGTEALAGSTLLAKIRAGAPTEAVQAEFRRWVYAGGKRLAGLVKRREWEAGRWAE